MSIQLTSSSKMMAGGLALSLGWLLFEGCKCDDDKQTKHPGSFVVCIGDKPTLVAYSGDDLYGVSDTKLDASKFDCKHPASPAYSNSLEAPFPIAAPVGGKSLPKPRAAGSGAAYLPPQLRDLPFTPPIPVPPHLTGCDPSAPDVIQTDHTLALVTRISTCPFQIKTTIPVATRPLQIALTPDGTTALVTSFDSVLSFIDLGANQVVATLNTDSTFNPHGVAILPDSSRAYITNFNNTDPGLAVIDMGTRKIISTLVTDSFPQGAFVSPDGSQLWLTYPLGQAVDVIDTLTTTYTTRLGIGQSGGVAFNSTGTRAYITSGATNSVAVVDTATFKILTNYPVGRAPVDIKMSYADEFLVVNNSADNSISVINLLKNTVTTTTFDGVPSGIAFVAK